MEIFIQQPELVFFLLIGSLWLARLGQLASRKCHNLASVGISSCWSACSVLVNLSPSTCIWDAAPSLNSSDHLSDYNISTITWNCLASKRLPWANKVCDPVHYANYVNLLAGKIWGNDSPCLVRYSIIFLNSWQETKKHLSIRSSHSFDLFVHGAQGEPPTLSACPCWFPRSPPGMQRCGAEKRNDLKMPL